MLNVVIDDERTFDTDEDVVYLRTADEAILWLAKWIIKCNYTPSMVEAEPITLWFDHDLGEGDDAMLVAKFLETMSDDWWGKWVKGINVHSQNPVGAGNLARELKWFAEQICGTTVQRVPLPNLV